MEPRGPEPHELELLRSEDEPRESTKAMANDPGSMEPEAWAWVSATEGLGEDPATIVERSVWLLMMAPTDRPRQTWKLGRRRRWKKQRRMRRGRRGRG